MFDTEDLHPPLGEEKQCVQGRMTGPEIELIIRDQVAGEREEPDATTMIDSSTPTHNWKQVNRPTVKRISSCTTAVQCSDAG